LFCIDKNETNGENLPSIGIAIFLRSQSRSQSSPLRRARRAIPLTISLLQALLPSCPCSLPPSCPSAQRRTLAPGLPCEL
jgi:hypothetical protein